MRPILRILVTLAATSPAFALSNMALILPWNEGEVTPRCSRARSSNVLALIGAIRNRDMKSLDLLAGGGKAYIFLLSNY